MNRRNDHLIELTGDFAYRFLLTNTLGMAEVLGYSPYDFKIVHDYLVAERGFEPIPHLSDAAYRTAVQARSGK